MGRAVPCLVPWGGRWALVVRVVRGGGRWAFLLLLVGRSVLVASRRREALASAMIHLADSVDCGYTRPDIWQTVCRWTVSLLSPVCVIVAWLLYI